MKILVSVLSIFILVVFLKVAKYGVYLHEISFIFAILALLGVNRILTVLWLWLKENDTTIGKKDNGQKSKHSS